jgi:hypothetical protein
VESWGGFRAHVSWSLEGAVIFTLSKTAKNRM